jgi:hypothetical protein
MRGLTRPLLLLVLTCAACAAESTTGDLAVPPADAAYIHCPPGVESSMVPCGPTDMYCYEVPPGSGPIPYMARCIGCDPNHRHWETDQVGLICDGGVGD